MLRERFGVSQRRACRVAGQHRSTQRLIPPRPDEREARLREFLRAFSRARPRWGWRRAAKAARELANALFEYLEIFHNRRRRDSALGMLTPIEYKSSTPPRPREPP
jgi:transposase InsO family protein